MSLRTLIHRVVQRGAGLLRWEDSTLTAGRVPPASVARTVVRCGCGHAGQLTDVRRWEGLRIWIGTCPRCSSTIHIAGRDEP